MRSFLCGLLFFFPALCHSTDLHPWYPRYLELQPRATYLLQGYNRVDMSGKRIKKSSRGHFLHLSLAIALEPFSLEVESTLATTFHQKKFNYSDFRLTGRYQLLNDSVGDPASLVLGMTATQSNKIARHDLSQFYHGGIEGELHAAVGKEWICEQFWTSRVWGVLGVGVADLGYPWARGDLTWEINKWDLHSLACFVHSLWGIGHHNLHPKKHFFGYGPIRHRSIDLGIEYRETFDCGAIISACYARRVYAYNFPLQANIVFLSFLYPFGL